VHESRSEGEGPGSKCVKEKAFVGKEKRFHQRRGTGVLWGERIRKKRRKESLKGKDSDFEEGGVVCSGVRTRVRCGLLERRRREAL